MATTKFDIPKDFPAQLRAYRERHGLSQARMADMLGVATNYVGMLEAGTRKPSGRLYRSFMLAAADSVTRADGRMSYRTPDTNEDQQATLKQTSRIPLSTLTESPTNLIAMIRCSVEGVENAKTKAGREYHARILLATAGLLEDLIRRS